MIIPIVLLGDTGKLSFIERIKEEKFGMMFTDRSPRIHYPAMPWAADNGAFACWKNGTDWDPMAWVKRMEKWRDMNLHPPLFAVVPDLPASGQRSLEFSRDYIDLVPNQFPKALALQDGMTFQSVAKHLKCYDWLFIGGSNAFKVTSRDWVRFARDNGKKIHYARASTLEKLEWAKYLEVDSLDSTFPIVGGSSVQFVRGHFCERTSQWCPVSKVIS